MDRRRRASLDTGARSAIWAVAPGCPRTGTKWGNPNEETHEGFLALRVPHGAAPLRYCRTDRGQSGSGVGRQQRSRSY